MDGGAGLTVCFYFFVEGGRVAVLDDFYIIFKRLW